MNARDDLSAADTIELLDDDGAVLARCAVLENFDDRMTFDVSSLHAVEATAVRVLDADGHELGCWPTARGAGARDLAKKLIERFAAD